MENYAMTNIDDAICYLLHPDVAHLPFQVKYNFLKGKGLRDSEIHIAFAQASIHHRRCGNLHNTVARNMAGATAIGAASFIAFNAVQRFFTWINGDVHQEVAKVEREYIHSSLVTIQETLSQVNVRLQSLENKLTEVEQAQAVPCGQQDLQTELQQLQAMAITCFPRISSNPDTTSAAHPPHSFTSNSNTGVSLKPAVIFSNTKPHPELFSAAAVKASLEDDSSGGEEVELATKVL